MLATVAVAGTVSYQDGVFRYRADPGQATEISFGLRPAKADGTPVRIRGLATSPVTAGPGCSAAPSPEFGGRHDILCAVAGPRLPRYRLSLTARPDRAEIDGDTPLRGVIYSGHGADVVYGSWRVYGGRGKDMLTGMRVHGGPGNDGLWSSSLAEPGRRSVLRGGAGNDTLDVWPGPGWAYGGPGNDVLRFSRHPDMLVGGPGRDLILVNPGGSADTVRVRHGGHDIVSCDYGSNRGDVYFADRSDEVDACRDARVLFGGRPRVVR